MGKLVAFCGKKQSGKSSSAKFVVGNEMMSHGFVKQITVLDGGDIGLVNENGDIMALDLDSKDPAAVAFFGMNLWPQVRKFSFADRLKLSVNQIFDVPMNLLYGTDEQKNTPTKVKLSDFGGAIAVNRLMDWKNKVDNNSFLTVRQLLQIFGTDLCRKIYDKCWIDGLISDVRNYDSQLSLVDDCRFKNEVYALKDAGAILIKLNKTHSSGDNHSSEIDLDDIDNSLFDLVIDNQNLSLEQKNAIVVDFLESAKIIQKGYNDNGVTKLKQ